MSSDYNYNNNNAKQIVETFLNGIGLGHAIPSFTKAGIVTPSALAELNINHYDALGVDDPDDRRKLFFLIERIKLSVPHIDRKNDSQEDPPGDPKQTTTTSKSRYAARRGRTSLQQMSTSCSPRRTRSMSAKSSSFSSSENNVDDDDDIENQNYVDDESVSADDEASSRRHSTGLRVNRRLRNRNHHHPALYSSIGTQNQTMASHQPENSDGETIHANVTVRTRSTTSLRSDDDVSSHEMKSTHPSSRKSKLLTPRNRRVESKVSNPISFRTGKQLSSIPSDSIAPPSPLVTLPLSKLEAEILEQQKLEEHLSRTTRNRRHSSHLTHLRNDFEKKSIQSSSDSETDHEMIQSSDSESRSTRRTSNSKKEICNSLPLNSNGVSASREARSSRAKSIGGDEGISNDSTATREAKASTFNTTRSLGRRSLPGTSNSSSKARLAGFAQTNTAPNSWANQVTRLRDDNQAEYDLFDADESPESTEESMRIRVVVRKRPMSKAEIMAASEIDIIHPLTYSSYGKILVYQPKTRVDLTKEIETTQFAFDNVFDETASNVQIYQRTVSNLIPGVVQGQQVSVFAYGQTGSGKSFTMLGSNLTGMMAGTISSNKENAGLYYLATVDLFTFVRDTKMSVVVSLFEIYGKKLFDLLGERAIVKCLEDGGGKMCFKGLSEHPIESAKELLKIIELGAKMRSTGSTSRNAESSRSHAVMQIQIRHPRVGPARQHQGKLTFIDLAGSERGADTYTASQATRVESAEINSSLLCLKEVIRALATGDHIPFRGCKLTQVLKDSFVCPKSKCVMLGCISPNSSNADHTLNTLLYCNRLKERNPESGVLPSSSRQLSTPKIATSTSTSRAFSGLEAGYEAEASSTLETDDASNDGRQRCINKMSDEEDSDRLVLDSTSSGGNDSDLLEKLLANSSLRSSSHSPDPALTTSHACNTRMKHTRGNNFNVPRGKLVDTHRTVLSALLAIVKDEMELAHGLGRDRDGLDEHLSEIDRIQARKIEYIFKLKQALAEYFSSSLIDDVHSDESFEDLRGD